MPRPEDLILARDGESFRAAALPLLDQPEALDALVPGLLRETALHHWREEYPQHIPHALLALLGALEARDLLSGPERTRPVVQALSYVAREKHLPRFDPESVPARGDAGKLARALAAGDFPAAYGAARALRAAGALEEIRETLLRDGARDGFNLFHRFIHAAKVFRRLRADPKLDADALLYPVIHYACLAPRAPRDDGPAAGNPVRLAEEVFARAVSLLPAAEGFDWVPVAHVATFAEAAHGWAIHGRSPERRVAPAAAAAFLEEVAPSVPPPPPDRASTTAREVPRLAEALEDAIAERNPVAARAAARALVACPEGVPELGRALLLACAGIDGGLAFSHDVKVTADAVRLSRSGLGERHPRCLPDLAAFLAGLPENGEWAEGLFPSR